MKLRTKLTAICAALLILTLAVLTAGMLWQVQQQAYQNLTERTKEQLLELEQAFGKDHTTAMSSASTEDAQKVMLRYLFQMHNVPGSVLDMNGELLSAPVSIDPRESLDVKITEGVRSARCTANSRQYLILGKATEIRGNTFQLYIVSDASFITRNMQNLFFRFAVFSLLVCIMGLLVLWLVICRALSPLSALQGATNRIASGHYGERAPIASKDEIGRLAKNFNQMAASVEEHVQSLKLQNERQQLFIGGVTHELKTPLTSLLLDVDTLRTVYLPEETRETLLEAMDGQLRWLNQMVHKLLKLLSMKRTAKFQTVSASALLKQVQELAAPIMDKYGTALEVYSDESEMPVDPDLLCSALINLIENSAKVSQPGQIITFTIQDNTLTISDRGCGIPEGDIDRITDPFYMGDPSRSKKGGGYGLGLALVKEIANLHSAKLEIQSSLGEGTSVSIVFPENGNQTVTKP